VRACSLTCASQRVSPPSMTYLTEGSQWKISGHQNPALLDMQNNLDHH
jgi:hypothetical protein